MNLFNKIVIILVILAAMVTIPLTLMFPEQAQAVLRGAADIIQENVDWLNTRSEGLQIGWKLLLSAIGMIVFVVGLLLLILEVVRFRRSTVQLKDGSGELMMSGVAGHVAYYVDLLPGVVRVKPSVRSTGKSVRATLHVEIGPGVGVLEKSNEVKQTAQQVLENELGLQVKDIKVVIKTVSAPKVRSSKQPRQEKAPVAAPPAEVVAPVKVEAPIEVKASVEVKAPAAETEATAAIKEDAPEESAAAMSEVIEVKAPPEQSF
jgi:hypothetical protein